MSQQAAAPPAKDAEEEQPRGTLMSFVDFVVHSWDDGPDSGISCFVVILVIASRLYNLLSVASKLFTHYDQALEWDCVVNAVCSCGIQGGLLLVWAAMSFGQRKTEAQFASHSGTGGAFSHDLESVKKESKNSHWIHKILKKGFWGHNLMPGGFAPRIFAMIMGLILFVNQNFIASMVKNGPALTKPETDAAWIKWDTGMACRADATIPSFWWGTRWYTQPPVGCYLARPAMEGYWNLLTSMPGEQFYVRPNASIPNLNNPVIDGVKDTTRVCMYQCAKWRILSTQTVLLHGGVVLAGGVFIERLTNLFSSKMGRYDLITRDSTEKQIKAAIELTLQTPAMGTKPVLGLFGRRLACLILLGIILIGVKYASARVDLDGYSTVDYYTTSAFLFSLVVAVITRSFHPHRFTPIIFTKDLWEKGEDVFKGDCRGTEVRIDLYEWFHIEAHNRARYLLTYARTLTAATLPFYEPRLAVKDPSLDEEKHTEEHLDAIMPSMPGASSLKERLLGLESRMKALEGSFDKAKAKPAEKKGDEVRCTKPYEGFSDVWVPYSKEKPNEGKYQREKVVIMKGAHGFVLGKLHDNVHCMVLWDNDDKVDIGGDDDGDGTLDIDNLVDGGVKLPISISSLIEVGPKWTKVEDWITRKEVKYNQLKDKRNKDRAPGEPPAMSSEV